MLINPDKLSFDLFSEKDDFAPLDFTEHDGSDSLGVDHFIKSVARQYMRNSLSAIHSVRYDGQLAAYFTLSMFAMQVNKLLDAEQVNGVPIVSYPAVQLGMMGVDKNHRSRGMGYWICEFAIGLALEVGKRIACRYVVLQTNKDKVSYYERCLFRQTKKPNPDGKIWMYRRIS